MDINELEEFTPPKGHQEIVPEIMHCLTIKNNQLYWVGEKLKTEQKLTLNWFEKIIAILVSIAAISSPLIAYFSYQEQINVKGSTANIAITEPVSINVETIPQVNEVEIFKQEDEQETLLRFKCSNLHEKTVSLSQITNESINISCRE